MRVAVRARAVHVPSRGGRAAVDLQLTDSVGLIRHFGLILVLQRARYRNKMSAVPVDNTELPGDESCLMSGMMEMSATGRKSENQTLFGNR